MNAKSLLKTMALHFLSFFGTIAQAQEILKSGGSMVAWEGDWQDQRFLW